MKKIAIKGTIVASEDKWIYDWFGMDSTSPGDVVAALEEIADGEEITVEISSPGGDVVAANEIYYALATYERGNITADIIGWAASAASYIALAASKVRILPTAMYMIHNVSGAARGDYHAMDQESKVLKNFNKAISNAYRLKTGMSESELLSLMDKESWLTPQDAKEKGFVDEIIGDENETLNTVPAAVYNAFGANIIPKAKIEEFRKLKMNGQPSPSANPKENGNLEETPTEPKPKETEENNQTVDYTAQIKKRIIF